MSVTIRVHYDGKVLVPDEPVDLPVNEPFAIEVKGVPAGVEWDPEKAREAVRRIAAMAVPANIPLEALRRENMYEDRS